uniref:ATP-grasp domain-containing protein n=1 Tax=Mucochytrium quahogii TaxID=96639 RepID=A0A7S2W377_9STRA|mmetsp:Transcript_11466/g.24858  ORF Transcript_11466/g.24858 Transcript_11466/m.24858 type:complete len:302 (+) Transcript_11466:93-998(+)
MDPVLAANAADAETQKLRLQALNGKRCLWITAPVIPMMSQGMIDRTQWVLDQGVELCAVFCGEEDRLYSIMKEKNLFSNAIFADLNSDDCGSQIIAAVEESGLQIDSVFSPYEQAQTIVGEVATGLGVQANDGKAYSIARSKNWTRDVCKEHNLAAPKTGICHTVEELIATVEHVGFPLILKPSSGAGSAGVFKATTIEQAEKAFHIIVADLTKNDNLNWNPGCNENSCLVEQLLVGDEFDVDILMWDSKPVYVRSVDNWPCMEPFFLETGSNLPSVYPREKLDILEKYALDCVLAFGFTF